MKDMTPEQKNRYRLNLAIEEIIVTEKEYVEDLRILLTVLLPFDPAATTNEMLM